MFNYKAALKVYKADGRTKVGLRGKYNRLLAEFARLSLEDLARVTKADLPKVGEHILVLDPNNSRSGVRSVYNDGIDLIYDRKHLFSTHQKPDGSSDHFLVPKTLPNGCDWIELGLAVENQNRFD